MSFIPDFVKSSQNKKNVERKTLLFKNIGHPTHITNINNPFKGKYPLNQF